jgi:hypothetical protein
MLLKVLVFNLDRGEEGKGERKGGRRRGRKGREEFFYQGLSIGGVIWHLSYKARATIPGMVIISTGTNLRNPAIRAPPSVVLGKITMLKIRIEVIPKGNSEKFFKKKTCCV